MTRHPPARRSFLAASLAVALTALAAPAGASWYAPPQPQLVHVDVFDRHDGNMLPVYGKDGRSYVVGVPGHEYAIRIRNLTGERVLAVTSVDGVNVISGETASPDQSGYVLEPWGSVEIAGWRKSLQRTAAFYFSEHSQSYAARTGRPFDVGVIGVAAFAEKQRRWRISEPKHESRWGANEAAPAAPRAEGGVGASADAPMERERQDAARAAAPSQPAAKLGTGHGRSETSHARQVTFERATSEPAQIVSLQYDRYENLVALGVIDAPRIARHPRPFPGLRFAPDPR